MEGPWVLSGGINFLILGNQLLTCVIGSMSTDPESRKGFGPYLEGVGPTFVDGTETRTIRYGVYEDLERAMELYGDRIAAFLVEPIQGEAG